MIPASNEESWIDILTFVEEFPETEHWIRWRSIISPVLHRAIDAGYNKLFRVGSSMHHILISTLDHHGLRGEPHVTLKVTEDSRIGIYYSRSNIHFKSASNEEIVDPELAFPVLTRYLQHLWTETQDEPIPAILRRKNTA